MRPDRALVAAIFGWSLATAPALAAGSALLSIKGIRLDPQHHLTKVVVRTWGVEVLAVCHVPKVANVSIDFDIDPGGVLIWKANSWHGELDQSDLNVLSQLFLVRVAEYQKDPRGDPRGEYHPASFEGVATIATIREPKRTRAIALHSDQFDLTPATRCPDPR
jgi:hypothetical protein